MSKLLLAQCNITTMAQHKLHRWPNDGPITYCYLGKHPLRTGHTRRVPFVDIRYSGLPVAISSMETTV
jgi:hypothetical protein